MVVLGIESTAHTFGIGLFDGKKVLANERATYVPASGGIVPLEAAKHHKRVAATVLGQALEKTGLTMAEVSLAAVAVGPGLPPCLLAGLNFARSLEKPLVAVNHCIAHIEIAKFDTGAKDPLTVYASGGNTQVIGLDAGRYRVYGETLDIGIGNALDKFGRRLGLPTPCGPAFDEMASRGKKYVELPYTAKGMDLVFSGLLTAAEKKIGLEKKEDLAFSFQETAYAMLTEVTERALAHTAKKEVTLTGGVAASKRLQEMIGRMCEPHKARFSVPRREYCGDNGAMIALVGSLIGKAGKGLDLRPRWRTDEVDVIW